MWVHATLIDSTIVANDAWIEPMSVDRRATFYAETRPIGRALGVSEAALPRDFESFETYVAEMLSPAGPIKVSAVARELGQTVLQPSLGPLAGMLPFPSVTRPLLNGLPAAAYAWTLWPAVGLLPAGIREAYGLPWGIRERLVAGWVLALWRAWRPVLPEGFRQMPQALAADRRMALAGPGSPSGRPQ
jgi:uncharacterized protein (DUF2236 family)